MDGLSSFPGEPAMTDHHVFGRRPALLAAGLALLFAGPLPALAADAAKEVAVAEQHAGYAASATLLTTAHVHLHHTVNCLVGPNGQGFDAKELNPCSGLGAGAIPDATDPAKKQVLQQALAKAEAGLAAGDLAVAKENAAAAEALLKGAM
jgi:hypothetical protein